MDDTMPLAQTPCELLLLQIHHPHDVGQRIAGIFFQGEQSDLRVDPYLREQDPPNAIDLRQ